MEEHKHFSQKEIELIAESMKMAAEGKPRKKWSRKTRLAGQINRRIFELSHYREEVEELERKARLSDDSDDLLEHIRKLRDFALEIETTLQIFVAEL